MKHIIAAALIAFTLPVWAHSGGTDAIGCHKDRSTGVYHCH